MEIPIGVLRVTVVSLVEGKDRKSRFLKTVVKAKRIKKGRYPTRSGAMNKEQGGAWGLCRHPPSFQRQPFTFKSNVLKVVAKRHVDNRFRPGFEAQPRHGNAKKKDQAEK